MNFLFNLTGISFYLTYEHQRDTKLCSLFIAFVILLYCVLHSCIADLMYSSLSFICASGDFQLKKRSNGLFGSLKKEGE